MTAVLRLCAAILILAFCAPGLRAGPSLLFDPVSGEVISQDRAGEPWYPASLTKLMTAYLVFQDIKAGKLTLDQKLMVSERAQKQPPSKLGMKAGSTISVSMALQVMLVYSANDMAIVLAEGSAGSIEKFVARMNATAASLGMTGSHFANPNGLFDERQVVTARDLAILTSTILAQFPEDAHYFSQDYVAIGKRKLRNRNALLRQMPEADGMKTGFICDSGFNLIGSASVDNRRLIAIALGERSSKARTDLVQLLLTSGFQRPVPAAPRPKITSIANLELGSLVPADMTPVVCRGKNNVASLSLPQLTGWGISLGRYETADVANKALRGRLLGARELAATGTAGVLKIPGSEGFTAVVSGMDQAASESLCGFYRTHSTYCDVLTPESFARIAAVAKDDLAAQPAIAEGSDDPPPPPKKKAPKRKKAKR